MKKLFFLFLLPFSANAQQVEPVPGQEGRGTTIFLIVLSILLLALCGYLIYRLRQQQQVIVAQKDQLLRQQLLTTQMNPHFMFNSLNAIQNAIFKNESLQAGTYLSQFSMFMRLTMECARQEYITLEKEIQLLELYLELQQFRFDHRFDYKITVDPEIETTEVKLPVLLAQPFIENAIEQGVFYKKEKGEVQISFHLRNDQLVYEIEDNGISLEAQGNRKPSIAMNQVHERIAAYNRQHPGSSISITITDRGKEKQGETGAHVELTFPYLLA